MQSAVSKCPYNECHSQCQSRASGSVSEDNDRFIRDVLRSALDSLGGAKPAWAAEAWALLADVLASDYLHHWNGAGSAERDEAEKAAKEALAIDDKLALAHYANGFVQRAMGNHKGAKAAFEVTTTLDSSFFRAYAQQANECITLGEPDKALLLVQKAIDNSPHDASLGMFYWIKGRAYFFLGNYSDAVPWLKKSIEERPTVWYNRLYLVSAYAQTGNAADLREAKNALSAFTEKFGPHTITDVISKEAANPGGDGQVDDGRARFHDGLRKAGM